MRYVVPLTLLCAPLISLSLSVSAAPPQEPTPSPSAALTAASLDQRLQERAGALAGAKATWLVQDLKSGEVYSSARADQLMHPASTNKLATTAVALDTLGANFRYTTRLWVSPAIPEAAPAVTPKVGSAQGKPAELSKPAIPKKYQSPPTPPAPTSAAKDPRPSLPPVTLYWEASGDPKITREVYREWVKALKAKGVTQVKALVIDDHLFTKQPLAPGYESAPEDDAAYRAAAGAVGYDFNRLVVRVRPGGVGKRPRVSLIPPITSAEVINRAVTTKTGKEQLKIKLIERPEGQVQIEVTGEIPRLHKQKRFKGISVARRAPHPLRFSGEALLSALEAGGVKLAPEVSVSRGRLPDPERRSLALTHRSPKLQRLLRDINTYSNNFMAEQTLLTLGLKKKGFGGWDEGLSFVRGALKRRFKLSDFKYVNGSGLFGEAGFSARQLTSLLRTADRRSKGRFAQTLPRSRRDGTIKRRFKALPKGAVRAKTGTLDGVSTLCGYLDTRDQQRLSFCVMMAGFPKEELKAARALQDEMVEDMWRLKSPYAKPKSARRAKKKRRAKAKHKAKIAPKPSASGKSKKRSSKH